jgi:hypothetical protein
MKTFFQSQLFRAVTILTFVIAMVTTVALKADYVRGYLTVSTSTALTNAPTVITNGTTSANTDIIDVSRAPTLGVTVSLSNTVANPAVHALVIPVRRSWDGGTTFETTAFTTLTITGAGITNVVWGTNITVGDATHLKFDTYQNTATNGNMNVASVKITSKPPWATLVAPSGLN